MAQTPFIFITGGVRSGKSHFAEQVTHQLAANRQLVYVATGVAFDAEMKRRIVHHQQLRDGLGWLTLEHPTDFSTLVPRIPDNAIVLWDCATTWLANECYTDDAWQTAQLQARIAAMKEAMLALHRQHIPLIVVSNEVLDAPIPPYAETQTYAKQLGLVHQWFVQQATVAIEMQYGYRKIWKGADEFEKLLQ
ncbi:bifunctional adenosylcobinamide kinase/adenosylcobinamide-phosphate guanylyltransferase [Kurthia massiliensis]|uniref:bifunctional adenosylcobinamide kinase/adenosylcobinamide-phosphate guanylyltransferase n=1 Tax=Kurthia massiliensis TaxID=1033739 RepID=UPI0002883C6B|nr:bifunctional adenosylcobinamide kinase/adenosylcobinamide-phosphate guanylyltransferase [Kurthia massiliensis]